MEIRLGASTIQQRWRELGWAIVVGVENDEDRGGTRPRALSLHDAPFKLAVAHDELSLDAKWPRYEEVEHLKLVQDATHKAADRELLRLSLDDWNDHDADADSGSGSR
jgi:hypothetical protein